MTDSRLIATSAFALGAAILATTAMQSTPAEARVKASGHTGSSAHGFKHLQVHAATGGNKQVHIGKLPPGSPLDTKHLGGGDIFTKPNGVGGQHGTRFPHGGSNQSTSIPAQSLPNSSNNPGGSNQPPIPSGTPSSTPIQPSNPPPVANNPGKQPPILSGTPTSTPIQPSSPPPIANNPGKQPPILSGTPTSIPIPPVTGPINPGNLPGGNKTPPVITGNPTRTPTPPVTTGPINPGDLPGSRPPVLIPNTTRPPLPPVIGSNPGYYPPGNPPSTVPIPTIPVPTGTSPTPNPGYGTGYAYRRGQFRGYADVGVAGDAYAPCWWLRSNYDRTGNVYWLNGYMVCLSQH